MFINSKLATNESTEINEPLIQKTLITQSLQRRINLWQQEISIYKIHPWPVFAAQNAVVDQPLSYTHPLEPRQFACAVERS